jgi:AcrR family transcriptional regulator
MMVQTADQQSEEIPEGGDLAWCEFGERERLLLRHARRLLREGGYDYLTINRLAEESGLSRMTLYKHFANRQDIVLKMSVQSTARRADLVERAALFRASTRERLAGMTDVSRVMMPHHMRHEVLIFDDGIVDKASPDLLQTLRSHEDRIIAAIVGVVREAVVAGDVTLPPDLPPEKLGLVFMHLEIGAQVLMRRPFSYGRYTAEDSRGALHNFGADLCDRLGWRPLNSEIDYPASISRMWNEIFPKELKQFGVAI